MWPEVEASGLPAHALGMTAARIEAPAVGGPGCDLVLCHGRVSFKKKHPESPTCYHRHPAAGGDAEGRGAGGLRHNLSRSAMAATAQQGLNGGTSRLPEANTVAAAVAPPKPSQACPDGRSIPVAKVHDAARSLILVLDFINCVAAGFFVARRLPSYDSLCPDHGWASFKSTRILAESLQAAPLFRSSTHEPIARTLPSIRTSFIHPHSSIHVHKHFSHPHIPSSMHSPAGATC